MKKQRFQKRSQKEDCSTGGDKETVPELSGLKTTLRAQRAKMKTQRFEENIRAQRG